MKAKRSERWEDTINKGFKKYESCEMDETNAEQWKEEERSRINIRKSHERKCGLAQPQQMGLRNLRNCATTISQGML